MAETMADKSYVNTSVDAINQRILGRYQNGLGKTWDDPNHMKFFNDGAVNFPYLSDGMWFLTQHKRWGLLKSHPDYLAVAKQINQIDLYKQAASAEGQRAQGPMRTSKLIDGVVWDGKDPPEVRRQFKIKA
jgi:nitrate/nitrite transport system substrate-binding protein